MNKQKVLVVDDEELAINVILHHLSKYSNYDVITTFKDPVAAFNFLKENKIDLVFTDIGMPQLSGIDLIKLVNKDVKFVVTTAYTTYALESFDLNVVDYLLKPITIERFNKAISRYEDISSTRPNPHSSFFVKDGEDFVKVHVEEIDFIEGMKDYAKIVCGNRYHMVLKTLKSLEKFLQAYDFMRVHKSFIVPMKKVLQYNGRCVIIDNNEIPVGPRYRDQLKDYLNGLRI